MQRKPAARIFFAGITAASLAACGGGGNSGGANPPGGPPQAGQIQFATTDISVAEAAGTATVTVSRTGGSAGAVSVSLASADGGATAGQDYTALTTTVNFADGDTADKAVKLPITNDNQDELDEAFTVTLSNATGGATLGGRSTATVRINDDDGPVPGALGATVGAELKKLVFVWAGGSGATSFRLMAKSTGGVFGQVGADFPATATSTALEIPVHSYNWGQPNETFGVKQYRVDACNASGCTPSSVLDVNRELSRLATGYLKGSDTSAGAAFGTSVAVSGDGKTVAIGAPAANGNMGSVFVYRYTTAPSGDPVLLSPPARIAAPSAQAMRFGFALALNDDGTTLAVGAPDESHAQKGIVGDYPAAPNTAASHSGAVFIYSRPGPNGNWSTTPVYIKAIDSDADDAFGTALALSADGTVLVAGAPGQDSPVAAIEDTNAAADSGAVYVSIQTQGVWSMLTGFLKATNIGSGDHFGSAVAMNESGSVILVGAPEEDGGGAGIDPVDTDTKEDSGAMYYFTPLGIKANAPELRLANATRRFKASNNVAGNAYGSSVAINRSSAVVAVGAPLSLSGKGSVHVYSKNNNPQLGNDVMDVAILVQSRFALFGRYGSSLAISADGSLIAVGSPGDSNLDTGVDSTGDNANRMQAGAVDVLTRTPNANWSQIALNSLDTQYVKAINTAAGDGFGTGLGLSADGNTLVAGAPGEDGNGIGYSADNNPGNDSSPNAGAAYLY